MPFSVGGGEGCLHAWDEPQKMEFSLSRMELIDFFSPSLTLAQSDVDDDPLGYAQRAIKPLMTTTMTRHTTGFGFE
jgi:hypothetical protein